MLIIKDPNVKGGLGVKNERWAHHYSLSLGQPSCCRFGAFLHPFFPSVQDREVIKTFFKHN